MKKPKNKLLEYKKVGGRAYAKIIDGEGVTLWRSRSEFYGRDIDVDDMLVENMTMDKFIEFINDKLAGKTILPYNMKKNEKT